jgi:hypothetical protein
MRMGGRTIQCRRSRYSRRRVLTVLSLDGHCKARGIDGGVPTIQRRQSGEHFDSCADDPPAKEFTNRNWYECCRLSPSTYLGTQFATDFIEERTRKGLATELITSGMITITRNLVVQNCA